MTARKIAIVTGGNRGIGLEIARQLMKADLFVVIGCARPRQVRDGGLRRAQAARAATSPAFPLDVNDTKSVRASSRTSRSSTARRAILVNNAGRLSRKPPSQGGRYATSVWRETFETNLFGAVRMCREVVPLMKKLRYGRIVNMSSGLGQLHQMGEGSPAYRVSKAALNALTRTLAAEVAGSGILVNSMSPGWVQHRHGRRGRAAHRRGGRGHRRVAVRSCPPTAPPASSSATASRFPGDPRASCGYLALSRRRSPSSARAAAPARVPERGLRVQQGAARCSPGWSTTTSTSPARQKDWVRERAGRALSRGTARSELPRVPPLPARRCARSRRRAVSPRQVAAAYEQLREYYHRVVEHVIPDMADFLLAARPGSRSRTSSARFAEDNAEAGEGADEGHARGAPRRAARSDDRAPRGRGPARCRAHSVASSPRRVRDFPTMLDDCASPTGATARSRPSRCARARDRATRRSPGCAACSSTRDAWRRPDYRRKLRARDEAALRDDRGARAPRSRPEQRAQLRAAHRAATWRDIDAPRPRGS